MHTFFKNLLLYTQAQIRQTEGRVMMTKEGSTKIVNFIIPRAGVLVFGHGHISHIMKMNHFLNNPFSLLLGIDESNQEYGNDNQGKIYQNSKFHDPQGFLCLVWSYSENAKLLLLFLSTLGHGSGK